VIVPHEDGLDQRVVTRTNPGRAGCLRAGGVESRELRFGGPLDFRSRWALRRELAAYRPDVVVTWMSRASRLMPRGDFVHLGRLGGYYDLKYFRKCDHLLGITPDIVDYVVREGWPAERAHYMPNFVEFEPAPPVPRSDHDTPAEAPLVLALGRHHVNKAFDVLLKALAGVPGAVLWLAGEGPERGALEALAAELGVASRVRFLGWCTDLAALYRAADICVFPSRYEPFGTITLEAWAAGVPLIAAAAAGPAGVVHDGDDGLLVPIDDVDALAAALRTLIDDPGLRSRLAAAGRARWRADFTKAAAVRRWRDLFAEVTA
jgi:glycosyltransferase involved in cell wall biosynthesis